MAINKINIPNLEIIPKDTGSNPNKTFLSANELKEAKSVEYFTNLLNKYPIKSIEDPFSEDDWKSSSELTSKTNIQIVGDDLFATNLKRLKNNSKIVRFLVHLIGVVLL